MFSIKNKITKKAIETIVGGTVAVKNDIPVVTPVDTSSIKETARKFKTGDTIDLFRLSDWAVMAGFGVKDVVKVHDGRESLRLVSSTAGEQPFVRSSRTLKLQGTTNIKLTFYLHSEPTDMDGITIYFSNNTGFTNMLEYTFPAISLVKGWNKLSVPVNRMIVSGTGSFNTNFQRVQVRAIPLSGKIADITLDSIKVDTKQQANIIFTFDDQWDTQYSVAFAEMRQRGIRGCIGVNGVNVGKANYMTWAQLEEVYDYGWDLVNHTNEHYNLGEQSYTVQKKDIVDGKKALDDRGLTRASNILFYPYGSFNADTLTILNEVGIQYARTIREHAEYPKPLEPQKLKIKNLLPYLTAVKAQEVIDDAIATGGTVIFLAHRLGTEDPSNMFWDITKFTTLLDYAKTKQSAGQANIITMTDWVKTF